MAGILQLLVLYSPNSPEYVPRAELAEFLAIELAVAVVEAKPHHLLIAVEECTTKNLQPSEVGR
jgi:hypothetical protein